MSPTARRILVWTLPESGHVNPTFRIATTLAARGHEVTYVAPPLTRPAIERHGLAVVAWFDDLYDEAWLARIDSGSTIDRRRAITERYRLMAARLRAGEGPAQLLRHRPPDVVVSDVNEPLLAFSAAALGLPVVQMHTALPQDRDPGVAPVRRFATPAMRRRLRLGPDAEWWLVRGQRAVTAALARPLGAEPPYRMTVRHARAVGLDARRLDAWTSFFPQLRGTPELVLCPRAFDLDRPHRALRSYVESGPRPGTVVAPPDLALPPGDGPLVVCSLGTRKYRADRTPQFFRDLVRVASGRPDLRFVIALGQHLSVDDLGTVPANTTAVPSIPQVELLQLASLMITHGGLGTVKESIRAGVPMVVLPLAVDQQANADRVERHDLGQVVELDRSTPDVLDGAIRSVLTSARTGRAIATMRDEFERTESADLGADVIEAVAAGTPPPAAAAPTDG